MNNDIHPELLLPASVFSQPVDFIHLALYGILICIIALLLVRKAVLFISIYKYRLKSESPELLRKTAYTLFREPGFTALLNRGYIEKETINVLNAIKYQRNSANDYKQFNKIIQTISLIGIIKLL